jgi:hypothetical protein
MYAITNMSAVRRDRAYAPRGAAGSDSRETALPKWLLDAIIRTLIKDTLRRDDFVFDGKAILFTPTKLGDFTEPPIHRITVPTQGGAHRGGDFEVTVKWVQTIDVWVWPPMDRLWCLTRCSRHATNLRTSYCMWRASLPTLRTFFALLSSESARSSAWTCMRPTWRFKRSAALVLAALSTRRLSETRAGGPSGPYRSPTACRRDTAFVLRTQRTLPVVNVGSRRRPSWLPMELCELRPGQRCTDSAAASTMKKLRPKERREEIKKWFGWSRYETNAMCRAFGVHVDRAMVQLNEFLATRYGMCSK